MLSDIIVIGTSAGGVEAMKTLASLLPQNLPVSLFLTIHTAPHGPAFLADVLSRAGRYPAAYALDHEAIKRGCIYIAAPDRHMLLKPDHVLCFYGPKENRFRPSIDVMFRSAAENFGPRVIGIVLTGYLDDGSEGLLTIRERGGLAIVQDPTDAQFRDMPDNALAYAGADYIRNLADIPSLLKKLSMEGSGSAIDRGNSSKHEEKPTTLTCPECGGVLNQDRDGRLSHFRCQVGHAYSLKSLREAQKERSEASLWGTMQTFDEKAEILRRLADEARIRGDEAEAGRYAGAVNETMDRANVLREMLEGRQAKGGGAHG